uniref:Uncharacterized protein n=1 Tax=Steinernema glaseri TaxID=37863 RepID=A0A1I8A7I1_9BILA
MDSPVCKHPRRAFVGVRFSATADSEESHASQGESGAQASPNPRRQRTGPSGLPYGTPRGDLGHTRAPSASSKSLLGCAARVRVGINAPTCISDARGDRPPPPLQERD